MINQVVMLSVLLMMGKYWMSYLLIHHIRIIKIWSTANGELVNSFIGHSSDINATALSECGTYLASCSNDGIVRIWHLESGVYPMKIFI